ncbi:TPA: UDP-N-acetylglucosamine--N-acetylmuramyl-(pentapeptide) pyrophosphoryl-undecaprenol N-acetylglucosamine transferase [Streptococcus equi subsp. zooepidemicus]|nr:UDP-N-acetylglucosamine--N-acetylmuramyl-(pentapeptide) pyrophosphoryl-undecaprenol N-acetylglucosamine transferase [Streptococcus equi subsp. zooepidemicus]HEL0711643.1 UDP-N-acetylglucosamine--N-acetylmuramyl-(pentapeptide) pyrophosphoryl-undecaprenol N-acetylglucosamine transferase [Streptococcus equi subsp. zooepidemicus]HEL0737060.1 UDP-N-acetylglucosamine--N-acetylmuramyl-(pentapeptide) pyrophosphoryl-undecaprenol N-acetylglucosamine transferase [Streptococcus equi subsp. zooepidemicus]
MTKKIIFTGGGTAGHVTLNLILIPKFIKDGWEVHYIGDDNGIEHQEIKKSGLDVTFHAIATGKLRRYFSWQNLLDAFKVGFGIVQSLLIIARLRPKALFSKGGFVSVPPVIAARLLGVPAFIHESDLSMGLANRIAYRFATTMYTTFEQEQTLVKLKHVGAVTKVTAPKSRSVASKQLTAVSEYFDPNLKTLLFIGGSAGARVFNRFVTDHPELKEDFNIINISGDPSLNELSRHLYRVDYVTDLYQPLMEMADLVVTRGGSNTLFELLAMRKLQLIIPLGKEASRGDQLENAHYFTTRGYAEQLLEQELTLPHFQEKVREVFAKQSDYLSAMTSSSELQSPESFYQLLSADISSATKEN